MAGGKRPDFTAQQAESIKALYAGVANEGQQKEAFEWIVERACSFRSEPFDPENDRQTAFDLGRQAVAREILYLATIPANILEEKRKIEDGKR